MVLIASDIFVKLNTLDNYIVEEEEISTQSTIVFDRTSIQKGRKSFIRSLKNMKSMNEVTDLVVLERILIMCRSIGNRGNGLRAPFLLTRPMLHCLHDDKRRNTRVRNIVRAIVNAESQVTKYT